MSSWRMKVGVYRTAASGAGFSYLNIPAILSLHARLLARMLFIQATASFSPRMRVSRIF